MNDIDFSLQVAQRPVNDVVQDFQSEQVSFQTIKKLYDHIKSYPFDQSDDPNVARLKTSLDRFVDFVDTVFEHDESDVRFRPEYPAEVRDHAIETVMTYKSIVELFFKITQE